MTKSTAKKAKKTINLALQGGGAHGAFTWGVLDRLVEEDTLTIEGISGTSAGAMNAVAFADGFRQNSAQGAKNSLEKFWKAISVTNQTSPLQRNPMETWLEKWNMDASPGYVFFDMMSRLLSPYQFNPFNFNPLRTILEGSVDFKALREDCPLKVYVSATNINRGTPRIFDHSELSADVLLASACVPYLFQAVEIDGEHYWDGGYLGNPPIYPLIYKCDTPDVVMVKINPQNHDGVPTNSMDILDRLNEINFNASLMAEMRAIKNIQHLLKEEGLDPKKYKNMHIHMIEAEELMQDIGVASKLNAEWDFLTYLRDIGRAAAERWLKANFKNIGEKTTIDITDKFNLRAGIQ